MLVAANQECIFQSEHHAFEQAPHDSSTTKRSSVQKDKTYRSPPDEILGGKIGKFKWIYTYF